MWKTLATTEWTTTGPPKQRGAEGALPSLFSLLKTQLGGPKHHTKSVDQPKRRPADILAFFICLYVYTS